MVYYRLVMVFDSDGRIAVEMLQRLMRAAVTNAREFLPAFRGVAAGSSPDGVLAARAQG